MSAKEAQARIKINKLLEQAGWRFFDSEYGRANVVLEPNVKLTQNAIDALGNDFESSAKGFIDFLLLDDSGFPLVVLEAKAEGKNPLIGKEQPKPKALREIGKAWAPHRTVASWYLWRVPRERGNVLA